MSKEVELKEAFSQLNRKFAQILNNLNSQENKNEDNIKISEAIIGMYKTLTNDLTKDKEEVYKMLYSKKTPKGEINTSPRTASFLNSKVESDILFLEKAVKDQEEKIKEFKKHIAIIFTD